MVVPQQLAQPLATTNVSAVARTRFWRVQVVAEPLMVPLPTVVRHVLIKHADRRVTWHVHSFDPSESPSDACQLSIDSRSIFGLGLEVLRSSSGRVPAQPFENSELHDLKDRTTWMTWA